MNIAGSYQVSDQTCIPLYCTLYGICCVVGLCQHDHLRGSAASAGGMVEIEKTMRSSVSKYETDSSLRTDFPTSRPTAHKQANNQSINQSIKTIYSAMCCKRIRDTDDGTDERATGWI